MTVIKVNIGCGSKVIQNWINYDSSILIVLSKFQPIKKLLFRLKIINLRNIHAYQ